MSAPIIFLSYSRKDSGEIKEIAKTLLCHGIAIWQDITNLGTGLAEARIREAIKVGSDGFVFYITPDSINSSFIRKVELPEAAARYSLCPDYQIIPLFGLPIKDASKALRGCFTNPITNFNGVEVLGKPKFRDNIVAAAQRVARVILDSLKISETGPVSIGLSSKQRIVSDVALHLDFTNYFKDTLPPPKIWKEFAGAMNCLKEVLGNKKRQSLTLHAFCHLSFGFLFGYTFRKTTGYLLEIEQITNGVSEIWRTNTKCETDPLCIKELPGTLESKDLCVKINLFSTDDQSVARYMKKHNLSFRAVLDLIPRSYPCTINASEAVAIASNLANRVKNAHARYGTNRVHLFTAIPLGLSVLIAYHLNATGTIQCYEFDNSSREYFRSCILS